MLGNFSSLFFRLLNFFKINFFKKVLQGHFVGPDLGPNSLQRLSADDKATAGMQ